MTHKQFGLGLLMAAVAFSPAAWAQDAPARGRGRDNAPGRRQDDGATRGRDRGPGRGGFNPTPEQREAFYNRMIDRQMERLNDAYGLDDTQKAQVRHRLEALREEDRATSDQRIQQMNAVRDQFRQLRERREAGEQIDPQQYRQLGEQMRDVFRASPLMNRERIMGEVDKIVPPEQAAQGRKRIEEQTAEEDRRREEMRERFMQWQQQGGGDPREFFRQQRENGNPAPGPPDTGGALDPANRDRGSRRDEWRRRMEERRRGTTTAESSDDNSDASSTDAANRDERSRRRAEVWPENALGPWESYVRDFTNRYRLDASQKATADSILRDLLNQRKVYESTRRDDIAAAQKIDDPALRQKQLDFVAGPINRMYEELKTKLERIPTIAQRETADGRPAATQPVAATQPAAGPRPTPYSRPSDGRRSYNRGDDSRRSRRSRGRE